MNIFMFSSRALGQRRELCVCVCVIVGAATLNTTLGQQCEIDPRSVREREGVCVCFGGGGGLYKLSEH